MMEYHHTRSPGLIISITVRYVSWTWEAGMVVNAQTARALSCEHHNYRFVVLGVVWTSYLIVYLSRLSVGPLAPFLKDSFHLSNAEVGSLMSATAITYAPSMIVAGLLVDRIGVKRILVGGTLVAGICVALLFVAPSYPALLALLALSGFGCGCIYPSGIKALMLWFPRREWATAIGLNQSAINVSGIAGAALLPTVAVELGWQYGFLFVGMVALVISAVCSLLYHDPAGLAVPPSTSVASRDEEDDVIADAAEAGDAVPGTSGWHQTLSLLRRRDVWLLCCTGLFLGIVEFSVLAHLVLFLNKSLLYTAVAAGGLRAICEAAGGVGKPGSGIVSDRLFRGRRKPALFGLCVGAAVVCVVFAAFDGYLGWGVYPCLVLFGVAAIGWGGLYGTMAGELGGKKQAGLAAGLCSAVVNLGIVVGPPAFGYLVDATGSYRASWIFMAICASVSVVTVSLVHEPHGGRDVECVAASSGGK
jgi:ACS family hexuronate transporter-like MFS transporter